MIGGQFSLTKNGYGAPSEEERVMVTENCTACKFLDGLLVHFVAALAVSVCSTGL